MTTRHPADPAATLATLIAFAATRPPVRFTDDAGEEPEVEWRNDYEERALDLGPRWHYPEGA